ncbi:MAG: alanine racemase [Pseudomonadota bacterium]
MTATPNIETPALLLNEAVLERNVQRMASRMAEHGVSLRPHIKTVKSAEVWRRALGDPARVTVSTLREAEHAFENGVSDILYAVGMAPTKLDRALALMARGADLTITVDSLDAAQAVAAAGAAAGRMIRALVEVDSDGHRAGVKPSSPEARAIAAALRDGEGASFRGVMTHAGGSYSCASTDEIRHMAERERRAVVETAAMLKEQALPCEIISMGSTPTATFAASFEGVTEVRAGVYMTMDLVMADLGVCGVEDIALSVAASVIGRQETRGQVLIDAGWMAMSRDLGSGAHGYGRVCDADCAPIGDLIVSGANQEHGVVTSSGGEAIDFDAFPVGRMLRVLPNHACATAAQFDAYRVLGRDGDMKDVWPRINGW